MTNDMPVFVRIDDYKNTLKVIDTIKGKIEQAKATLAKINQLKNEEDSELDLWRNGIEEVERKVEYIDKTLFQPNL